LVRIIKASVRLFSWFFFHLTQVVIDFITVIIGLLAEKYFPVSGLSYGLENVGFVLGLHVLFDIYHIFVNRSIWCADFFFGKPRIWQD